MRLVVNHSAPVRVERGPDGRYRLTSKGGVRVVPDTWDDEERASDDPVIRIEHIGRHAPKR